MRKQVALGVALGGLLLLLVDAATVRLGLAPGMVPKLAGTSLWITSRAAGVTAFIALTLDVVFGLFVSTGAADRWVPRAKSVELHRGLSLAALGLTALHALALVGDRFVRFDVLDLVVPFLSSYRSAAVALGVLAAYGALLVHASFAWRRTLGAKAWRALHYLAFVVFAAALLHGVLAGSDTSTRGMQALYVASVAAVGALAGLRVVARWRQLARQAAK